MSNPTAPLAGRPLCVLLLAVVSILAFASFACAAPDYSTRGAAADIGVTPESMVVSGFTLQDISIVLDRIQDAHQIRQELATLATSSDQLSLALAQLQQMLAETPNDVSVLSQIEALTQDAESLTAAIALKRSELHAVALANFAPAQVQRLTTWKNGAIHRVPAPFRTKIRSDTQWKSIVQALRAERRAVIRNEPLDPEFAAVLQPIYEDQLVIDASIAIQMHYDDAKALFAGYVN